MSDSPCTGCRATNNGRLMFFYVNYYDDQELLKRRCRLCQKCVAELVAPLIEGADFQNGKKEWQVAEFRVAQ